MTEIRKFAAPSLATDVSMVREHIAGYVKIRLHNICCVGSKFTECPPCSKFHVGNGVHSWSFEKHSLKHYAYKTMTDLRTKKSLRVFCETYAFTLGSIRHSWVGD